MGDRKGRPYKTWAFLPPFQKFQIFVRGKAIHLKKAIPDYAQSS